MVTTEHDVRHTEGCYRIPAGLAVVPAPDALGHFLLRELPESIFGPANLPNAQKSALRRMAENGEFYIDGQHVIQEVRGQRSEVSSRQVSGLKPQVSGTVPAYLKPYLT